MSSRNRTCKHLLPSTHVSMPPPQRLLELQSVMGLLIDCAAEFDSIDPHYWTAEEWVRWLDMEVRQALKGAAA